MVIKHLYMIVIFHALYLFICFFPFLKLDFFPVLPEYWSKELLELVLNIKSSIYELRFSLLHLEFWFSSTISVCLSRASRREWFSCPVDIFQGFHFLRESIFYELENKFLQFYTRSNTISQQKSFLLWNETVENGVFGLHFRKNWNHRGNKM